MASALLGGEQLLDEADLLTAGEGRINVQMLSGKAPTGIGKRLVRVCLLLERV